MVLLILILLILVNILIALPFYTKIINTPIFSNKLLKFHHIILLQQTPFMKNQTIYNNIYAIDFIPNGNLFEIMKKKTHLSFLCENKDLIINNIKYKNFNYLLYKFLQSKKINLKQK